MKFNTPETEKDNIKVLGEIRLIYNKELQNW